MPDIDDRAPTPRVRLDPDAYPHLWDMITNELSLVTLMRLRSVCKSLKSRADCTLWSHVLIELGWNGGWKNEGEETVVTFRCPRPDRLPSLPGSQWKLVEPVPPQLAFVRVLDSFGEGNWDDNDDTEEPGGPLFTALAETNAFPNLETIRFPIEHPYGRQPVPFRAKTAVVFTMWSLDMEDHEITVGPYCALPPGIEELIIHSTSVNNAEDPETALDSSQYSPELRRIVLIVQPLDDVDHDDHGGDACSRCEGPCDAPWWDPEDDYKERCEEANERLEQCGGWIKHIFEPKHFAAAYGGVEYVIVGHRTRHNPSSTINAEFELRTAQKMREVIEEALDDEEVAQIEQVSGSVEEAVTSALRFQTIGDYRAEVGDEKFLLHSLQANYSLSYPDLANKHYNLAWRNDLDNQAFGLKDFT